MYMNLRGCGNTNTEFKDRSRDPMGVLFVGLLKGVYTDLDYSLDYGHH